jgi:hypothetical protein
MAAAGIDKNVEKTVCMCVFMSLLLHGVKLGLSY